MTACASAFAAHAADLASSPTARVIETSGVCPFFEMLPAIGCVEMPPRNVPASPCTARRRAGRRDAECAIAPTVLGFVCAPWSGTFPLAEYGWPR